MYRKKLRIISLCALVVCLVVAYFFWHSVDKYTFGENGFYPLSGMKYPVNIGDTAQLGDDERFAILQLEGFDEISGEETCVYVDDRDAIILTSAMSIIPKPSESSVHLYKLPAFTDVQRNISNLLITSKNHQFLGDAILLFNGNDTYITLESAALSIGDKKVALSPLSYVVVCRDQWVQYYDYSKDKFGFEYIELDTNVEIKMNNWDLRIDAGKDKGALNGEEFMFFTSVTYLDDFFNHYY